MKSSIGRKVALGVSVSVLSLAAMACSSTVNKRGYLPTPGMLEGIRVGVDNKASLEAGLGSPSLTSTFSDNVWYYVSSTQEDYLFFRPEETERQVVAVAFNADSTVASVKRLGLEDGVEVSFSDRETPARGRELTFLQQIFGNVGRGSPIGGINDTSNDPRERR